jgi:hypothetical protein
MEDETDTAERVRRACVAAALAAYEDAGLRGLCADGRWESAVSAMRRLDLEQIASRPSVPESGVAPPKRDSAGVRAS